MERNLMRDKIVAEARTWLGTPYQHQCSQKGAGTDCLGLVRGVWRHFYDQEPMAVPPYSPDWAEQNQTETLLEAARVCLTEIPLEQALAGDLIMFRMAHGAPCKHLAILSGPDAMIHAYWGRCVVETALIAYWRRRRPFAFSFPFIIEA